MASYQIKGRVSCHQLRPAIPKDSRLIHLAANGSKTSSICDIIKIASYEICSLQPGHIVSMKQMYSLTERKFVHAPDQGVAHVEAKVYRWNYR